MKLSLFLLGYLFPLVVTRGRQDESNWCKNGGVRLENGTSQLEGRVEFCHRHQWVTVCDYQWGPAEAATVCRQLNITSTNGMIIPVYRDFFGTGKGEPLMKDVQCGEHETQLKHCNHTLIGNNETDYDFCSSFQAAGVICQGSSNCTDGEVRLTEWNSRVEICLNRVWGTVCNTNWDETDAETVCRQLTGERDSITLIIAFADDLDFAEGKPPILLNEEVNCSVAHIRLIDCQSSSNDEECSDIFGVYAGAICQVEQVNVSSVNKTDITSYTTSQKLKPTLTTASVSGQLLTTPATLHESYALTIISETVIVRRTLSPSPGSTPSIDVSQVQTVTVDVEPSLSQFTTSKMTDEVTTSATHDLVTSSITDETLTQPSIATTDTFERSYTTLSEKVNPTTSRMVFQVIKTTAMINSNGGANGTSSPVYGPILGSTGALVFVLCAIVVLVTGIFVIVRHKKKYKIQEYSTVEGATALDNPVYDATEYLLVTTTTNNGVEGSDQTPVSSSQNGSANTLKHVVYESLKCAPNYHKEQMYEAPQVLVTSDTKGANHTEVNTTEGNDDYSRLNMRDASYATLEPYIPGRTISSEVEPTNEEVGYSKLQHI